MLKDYLTFSGIGQCGGNIVSEFELNDSNCFYINTSLEDLETIVDAENGNWHHIRNTKGMAKDRDYAKKTITSGEIADIAAESIYKKYANSKMYFFVFSLSGGTGGGMANTIMKSFKEMYPEKIVNAIVVLPHSDEDMIMQYNAFECLKELKSMYDQRIINNIQILDNDKKDFNKKTSINKTISSLMNTITSFQSNSIDGNLDEQELENIFSTRGLTVIHEFSNKDFQNEVSRVDEDTIYNKIFKNPTMQAFIFDKSNYNTNTKRIMQDAFGIPTISHETTWDNEESIIISTGIDFSENVLNIIAKPLLDNYKVLKERKMKLEQEVLEQFTSPDTIDINSVTFEDIKPKEEEAFKPQSAAAKRRRGRGFGVDAERRR